MAAILGMLGCGAGTPDEPKLPESATPGWTRKSFGKTEAPAGLPTGAKPECWKAAYASTGDAQVWACGYAQESSAFDAMQRARAEADTVKFQEGKFLVIVQWHGVTRDEITALVRAVQRNLKVKP